MDRKAQAGEVFARRKGQDPVMDVRRDQEDQGSHPRRLSWVSRFVGRGR